MKKTAFVSVFFPLLITGCKNNQPENGKPLLSYEVSRDSLTHRSDTINVVDANGHRRGLWVIRDGEHADTVRYENGKIVQE